MQTSTGILVEPPHFMGMDENQRKGFIEVKRDLAPKEKTDMQIRLYAPCGCGSGRKLKFCCKTP